MNTFNKTLRIIGNMLLIAISLVAGGLTIAYLLGHWEEPHQTIEVVVIWDVTEKHRPHPEAEDILQQFGLDTNDGNGAIFRFTYASDISLNRQTVITLLPSGSDALTNQFDRKRDVDKFTGKVTSFLDSLDKDTVGKDQSSIYIPIVESLNRLAEDSSAQRKVLLVYSDLRENTGTMNFYDKKTLGVLKNDPTKIQDQLAALAPVGDLSGIEVYLLYEPKDAADDVAYRTISGFYKNIFENAGATVIVSANIVR